MTVTAQSRPSKPIRNSTILTTIVHRYLAYTNLQNADEIIRAYDYALAPMGINVAPPVNPTSFTRWP